VYQLILSGAFLTINTLASPYQWCDASFQLF